MNWFPGLESTDVGEVSQAAVYRLEDLTAVQQIALWGSQEFYRAYSTVNGGRKLETDLFEGLR